MAVLLRFNRKTLNLDIVVGVKNKYNPRKKYLELVERAAAVQEKRQKLIEEFNKRYSELLPEINAIEREVAEINEKNNPQLKQLLANQNNQPQNVESAD